MAYEHKPGRGSAFKNKRYEKEGDPNYTGDIMLPDGTLHWLDVWINEDKNGNKYLSHKIGKPKQGAAQAGAVQETAPAGRRGSMKDQLSDDIPF